MIKKFGIALSVMLVASSVQARFSDGLLLGGFAGLTAGIITSAIAQKCSRPRVVVVEQPVVVERPVYFERQVVVQRPMMVRKPVVEHVIVDDAAMRHQRAELEAREESVRQEEMRQQRKAAERRRKEDDRIIAAHKKAEQKKKAAHKKTVEMHNASQASVKERELALKERQVELDLTKAKKELLAEENRKKELTLREKALEKRSA